jgi:mercuric reductase
MATPAAPTPRATHRLAFPLTRYRERGRRKSPPEDEDARGAHLDDVRHDAILAGVYAIEAARTVADLADAWDPYLTMGEAINLAAMSFTRDPSKLSCCAA